MKRARKQTILEQIAEIRGRGERLRVDEMARILDGLNVMEALDTLRRTRFSPNLSWGARAFSGITPSAWVGVLIWDRPAGYFGYKTLRIIGVWAVAEGDRTNIIVGTKLLPFTAPFYEAEAYHKLIRDGFDLYYSDNGAPPDPARRVFTAPYAPDERLTLRQIIPAQLASCVE
ncbi:MAG: hypothetical protein IAE80_13580 [Anaerolinea sp.]|nr:hypothetical protein [Anaerolinea sp.]